MRARLAKLGITTDDPGAMTSAEVEAFCRLDIDTSTTKRGEGKVMTTKPKMSAYEKAQDTLFTHAVVLLLRLTRDPDGRQSIPQLISLIDDGIQRTGLKDITAVHVLVALAERDSMGDGGAVWGTKVEPWADEQWVVPLPPIKQAIGPFLVLSAL